MKIEYTSSLSGGEWWLSDDDWKKLEAAGWTVEWGKERWLGALAKRASKDFDNVGDAIREFEKVTGQKASDEGCPCCGAPHSFSWEDEYASGNDCLEHLYAKVPKSLREATEALNDRTELSARVTPTARNNQKP
jgi:hypothetical protein